MVSQSSEKLPICTEIKVRIPKIKTTNKITVTIEAKAFGKRSFLLKNTLTGRTKIANKSAIIKGIKTPFPTYKIVKIIVIATKTEANFA